MGLPCGSVLKNLPANTGDMGLIPGPGRSSGEGNGNPLQYSCLGNPWTEEPGGLQSMGSQKSQTQLATKQQHQKLPFVKCPLHKRQLNARIIYI